VIALLPLIAGLLLARFVARRGVVMGTELGLFTLAAVVLVSTAPDHDQSRGTGVVLSVALAPLCALAVVLGSLWRGRSGRAMTHAG
jgi:hypothetical protein